VTLKVLAIASGGGHWTQLLRLRKALDGCEVIYSSTRSGYATDVVGSRFVQIPDATRWDRTRFVVMAIRVAWLALTVRPHVVISTGAAPGYVAIRVAKLLGARTIWIDSVANVEVLSLSGQHVGKYADLWLTQWPHLARPTGPHFFGSVM